MARYIRKHFSYDFDSIIYVACVLEPETANAEELHQRTYTAAETELPAATFLKLTDPNSKYRDKIYRTPSYFVAQFGYYRVKAVYILALRAFVKSGLRPFQAIKWLNILIYSLLALVVFAFLTRYFNIALSAAFSVCIMTLQESLNVASVSTPDLMASLFMVCTIVSSLQVGWIRYLSILFSVLLVLTRPENVLFAVCLLLIVFLTSMEKRDKKLFYALGAAALVAHLFQRFFIPSHSYSLLYKLTFSGTVVTPDSDATGLTLIEYLKGLRFMFVSIFYSTFGMIVLLQLILVLVKPFSKIIQALGVAIMAATVMRILLFPDCSTRYFSGVLLSTVLLLLVALSPFLADNTKSMKVAPDNP